MHLTTHQRQWIWLVCLYLGGIIVVATVAYGLRALIPSTPLG